MQSILILNAINHNKEIEKLNVDRFTIYDLHRDLHQHIFLPVLLGYKLIQYIIKQIAGAGCIYQVYNRQFTVILLVIQIIKNLKSDGVDIALNCMLTVL